ncbi:MAG: TMEM14 family protein [archaeon]
MKKKALESVEVWMWLIAGLIIGGLIFVAGYSILNNWFYNKELQTATESFALLKTSILSVCKLGAEQEEVKRLILPRIVNNISIQDSAGLNIGVGSRLCIDIKNEPILCINLEEEPNNCAHQVVMKTLDLNDQNSLFYKVQKASSENNAINMRFDVTKEYIAATRTYKINIEYKEEFIR